MRLCLGVIEIVGAEHSGSLITARLAQEQGREVSAVPGNITSRTSFGPNYLIKDGAKLVQHWRDVIEELPYEVKQRILALERAAQAEAPSPSQPASEVVELSEAERAVFALLTADDA